MSMCTISGADVNIPDGFGRTPLRHAIDWEHNALVAALRAVGDCYNRIIVSIQTLNEELSYLAEYMYIFVLDLGFLLIE